jgi:hypothetical protein
MNALLMLLLVKAEKDRDPGDINELDILFGCLGGLVICGVFYGILWYLGVK